MVKIVFGIMLTGALYYVMIPLLSRRVNWMEAEDPADERIRELDLKKRINLKALKDIEFELASGKINEEDYNELRAHYLQRISRIMNRMESLADSEEAPLEDIEEDDKELPEEGEYDLYEEWEEDEEDDQKVYHSAEEEEDYDKWEEEDEVPRRRMSGPAVAVIAFALALLTGAALFQMGRKSARQTPQTPAASFYAPSSEEAGLEHLVKYVQENPWNVTSHLVLGEYYLGEGNTDLALSHFTSAEQVAPQDSRVLSDLGKLYRKLGNPDQAIEKFRAAVEADPESLEYLYHLALVYGYDKGDPDQAVQLFKEILSRQPDDELRATVNEELRSLGSSDS